MQKYLFRPYSSKFLDLYKKERNKLKKLLPKDAKIEHVGSTAVPMLKGKGLIDIIISVRKKDINKIKNKLNKTGYEYKSKPRDKERLFFQRDYKYVGKTRRLHIHLTVHNSKTWNNILAVRNYLRKHQKEAKEYENIKKKAIIMAKGEGKIYRSYKKKFLENLTKKALKEAKSKKASKQLFC